MCYVLSLFGLGPKMELTDGTVLKKMLHLETKLPNVSKKIFSVILMKRKLKLNLFNPLSMQIRPAEHSTIEEA